MANNKTDFKIQRITAENPDSDVLSILRCIHDYSAHALVQPYEPNGGLGNLGTIAELAIKCLIKHGLSKEITPILTEYLDELEEKDKEFLEQIYGF